MLLVNMVTVTRLTVHATGQHVDHHPVAGLSVLLVNMLTVTQLTVHAPGQHVDRHPLS